MFPAICCLRCRWTRGAFMPKSCWESSVHPIPSKPGVVFSWNTPRESSLQRENSLSACFCPSTQVLRQAIVRVWRWKERSLDLRDMERKPSKRAPQHSGSSRHALGRAASLLPCLSLCWELSGCWLWLHRGRGLGTELWAREMELQLWAEPALGVPLSRALQPTCPESRLQGCGFYVRWLVLLLWPLYIFALIAWRLLGCYFFFLARFSGHDLIGCYTYFASSP